MRKKKTALIVALSFLIIGVNTGCNADVQNEDYSEITAVRGDIADGLTKEGTLSVGNVYEKFSFFVPEEGHSEKLEQSKESEEQPSTSILQIEEVYAVPGLAVNVGVPILKLTDQSLQEYKAVLERGQKKAKREVSLAEMEREEKGLDAEYTYKKSMENGTTAEEKRNLAIEQLENNIKFLEDERKACQQRISDLKSDNASDLEIEVEENNLKDLENRLEAAKNEKEIKTIQIEQEYDQAKLDYTYAEDVRKNAVEGLDDAVEQAKEHLEKVDQALEQFNATMADGVIKATHDGTVLSVNCKAGEFLPLDETVITYADPNQITMTVGIPQDKVLSFHVGDEAALKLDVYDGEVISGVIAGLEPNASKDLDENGYNVTVQMKDKEKKVYSDMTGRVVFTEKAVKDVIKLPVEAIIREKTDSYVQIYDGNGKITKTEVKTGFSDGEYVEIISGLEEGAKVLIKNEEEESEKKN